SYSPVSGILLPLHLLVSCLHPCLHPPGALPLGRARIRSAGCASARPGAHPPHLSHICPPPWESCRRGTKRPLYSRGPTSSTGRISCISPSGKRGFRGSERAEAGARMLGGAGRGRD